MAKYDNFFNKDNPLNLNSSFDTQMFFPWKKDDALKKQQEEELKRLLELLRQLLNDLLQKDRAQAFVNNLSKVGYDASKALLMADILVASLIDDKTGKLAHPAFSNSLLAENIKKRELEFLEYSKLYNDVNNVGKALINKEFKEDGDLLYTNQLKNLIKKDVINRGFATEDTFEDLWQDTPNDSKLGVALRAIGNKYFKGDTLEEFESLGREGRFSMLASFIKNNSNYESLASKHKDKLDWGNNFFSRDWKEATEIATNRFLRGITGNDGWNIPETIKDVVGGGAFAAVGSLGNLIGGAVGSAGEWVQSRFEGMGFEEDVDDYISKRADSYITLKALELYADIISSPEKKAAAIDRFDTLSSQKSNEYRAEKGTSLTEVDDSDKVMEYAKMVKVSELYNEDAANKNVMDFWTNHIASKQSPTDKLLNTGGQFINTFAADVASFIGVLANPIFMAFNPEEGELDAEGYSDALVERNPILTWATNLQETGAWTSKEQDKYKELGVNKFQIYKSVSDQNNFISWNDFYDIVGLYGFTAATTALSLGGSAAIKGLSGFRAARALNKGKVGYTTKILSLVSDKAGEVRLALKAGLADGATEAEITAAKEAAAKIASSHMYRGNLTIGGMMGTAEGALEAKSTYNTFIEENTRRIEEEFKPLQDLINDDARVRDFMLSSGYTPDTITTGPDGLSGQVDFSQELYALARKQLQDALDDKKNAALERMRDNAADAAAVNFLSNSCINGFLNVFAKEAVLSRDAREAARIAKKKNKVSDLIDVIKKGDSWEAVVKKAVGDNSKRNLWRKAKDITGKSLKTAGGEFIEEATQTISDLAARDALQYDLNQYLGTVYDKDARESFQSDWMGMLNVGLNSIMTNATDLETLKAGVFGGLSSMIGGFSPAGIGSTVKGFIKGRTEEDKGFKGTALWIGRTLGNLYLGGIQEAFRDNKEELQTALRLVESTNAWLNTAKNQELLTHMGGAIGYKKALEDAILSGDLFNAHDSKLGLAVENAFMLLALKDTDYGRTMLEKISLNAELLDAIEDENKFDENGRYIGNLTVGEDGSIKSLEDWVSIAINTYKNQLGDATRSTNLTDKQIALRIGLNANEFIQVQNEVIKALQRIKNIFKEDNLDPLAELAFVYALMAQENTRERRDSLSQRLNNAIHGETLTEQEKEELKESGLDLTAIDFMIEHGTLEKAEKKYNDLNHQMNELNEKLHNKKTSREEKQLAKNRYKYLELEARRIGKLITIEKERRKLDELPISEESLENGQPKVSLTNEAQTIFTEGDIANMSVSLRAEVIANKEKFTKELQEKIDNFLNIARRNLSEQEEDIALSNEEVAKDFIDLATLQRKANGYDKFLSNYINNPYFLSTTAAQYREKERTRTLRHLYKEDLQIREGESVLDFKERIDKKIQTLREQGKQDDANILAKLVSENEKVAKVRSNLEEVVQAETIYLLLHNNGSNKELDTLEFILLEKALLTIISESGMSLKEIKEVLDKADTTTIANFLTKRTSDGQYSLNKALIKGGLKPFDFTEDALHNEELLAPTLLLIKDFVDFYISKKDAKITSSKEAPKIVGTLPPSKLATPPPPPRDSNQLNPLGKESPILTITAPGGIEKSSPLGLFLSNRGVSMNVKNIDTTQTPYPYVYFGVILAYDKPVVFALLAIPKERAVEGKTVHIGDTDYQIIGVLNLGNTDETASTIESSTIAELGKKAHESLLPHELGKLLFGKDGPIRAEFSKIDPPTAVSSLNLEDPRPIKDLLKGSDKDIDNDTLDSRIDGWVAHLMKTGKKVKETIQEPDGTSTTTVTLRDSEQYPVKLNEKDDASSDAGKFPIGGSTLEEVIKNLDFTNPESIKKTIALLKENEFFEAYFDAWRNFTALTSVLGDKSGRNVYETLIGNFFFLGHTWIEEGGQSSKESYLNPRILDGKLLIDSFDKTGQYGKKKTFEFPLPSGNTDERLLLGLKALLIIVDNTREETDSKYFSFFKPQLSMNIIDNKNRSTEEFNTERKVLKGLIKAGLLVGYAPESINRRMEVNNPFAPKAASTRSNDSNASLFDPAPKGVVKGGKVDIETGGTLEGNPETPKRKMQRELNAALKKALEIVDRILERSNLVEQKDSNDETYLGVEGTETEGITYSRVTSAKQAYIGAKTEPFEASEAVAKISHAYGNTVDATIRAALEVLNAAFALGKSLNSSELLKEILKDIAFEGKEHIPNWSDYQIKEFLNLLITLHQVLVVKEGWTIVPKNIRAFGMANVSKNGTVVGKLPISGTLDLLAYDKEGKFHIIDIKSIHKNEAGQGVLENNRDEWEAQVSSYLGILLQQEEDIEFGLNYILPVILSYSMPSEGSNVEVADDKMTVLKRNPNDSPTMKASPRKDNYEKEDFLFAINTLEFQGYEEGRLSDADKKRVLPLTTDEHPLVPENKKEEAPIARKEDAKDAEEGNTIDDIINAINPFSLNSKKTTRQARFTEFINNHIAPVAKVRIGILSRTASVIKSLLDKNGKNIILKKELANIFFNGDTFKLEMLLKGLKISWDNIPVILLTLRNYYLGYTLNLDKYIANIIKRHNISKAVYNYLKGTITQNQLEEELNKYSVSFGNVVELTEYMLAVDKLSTADKIISKLETSGVLTEESYNDSLQSMTSTMEAMLAKLDFLNTNSAERMLKERVNSVQKAIESNLYKEEPYRKSSSIDALLSSKTGSYGATKLLRGVSLRTKNSNFKRLANVLLRLIKEKNLVIPITVEDLGLNFIEGSTKGKAITIHKNSLDSYEHFERVLLHEMLHAVIETSPEMKIALQKLLNLAILNLQKASGKTVELIKEEHYGLTNVDEFISEFFTNYAFQETLKTIGSNDYSNIFDKFIGTLKEKIFGEKSLYSSVSKTMETVLGSTNIESTYRKTEENIESLNTPFSLLSKEMLGMVLSRGFSIQEYNHLTTVEREQIKNCCK